MRKSDGTYRRICVPVFISRSSITIGFSRLRSMKGRCICSLFAVPSIRIHCGGESLDLEVLRDLSGIRQRTKDAASRTECRCGWGVARQSEYFRIMHNSMFVLCPRGVAPSSYRIFEAMKAGRVPVIIAMSGFPPVARTGPSFRCEFLSRVCRMCHKYSNALLTGHRKWAFAHRKHGSAGSQGNRHSRR